MNLSSSVIEFSGMQWDVKAHENKQWGPGPNYFSSHPKDVWMDEQGSLHLSIVKRNDKWYSTEVVSKQAMGYGTYTFTVFGDLMKLPENTILGLFTWDDSTYFDSGNSELDIEISKWGNTTQSQTVTYAVQPIGVDPVYSERIDQTPIYKPASLNGFSTHEIQWRPDRINWRSYRGQTKTESNLIAQWEFTDQNPPREKIENGILSNPFVIPSPGQHTHARINFWIQYGSSPVGEQPQEIIVKHFEYNPH